MLKQLTALVLFFNLINPDTDTDCILFIQPLILISTFHIHKCKWSLSKPNFTDFINDFTLLMIYTMFLFNILNKKAGKTCSILKKYNLM